MRFLKKIFGSNKENLGAETPSISMQEFRERVIVRLKDVNPDIISTRDENSEEMLHVSLGDELEGKCDLTNNYKSVVLLEENLDECIDRMVDGVVVGLGQHKTAKAENLRLLLRTSNYLHHSDTERVDKIAEPFCGELHKICMADLPTTLRGLNKEDFETLGTNNNSLLDIAKENTRQLLPKTFHDDSLGFAILFSIEDHAHLAPSLILFDEFWEQADKIFPDGCLIAIPRRDQLFLLNKADPNAISNVKQLIHVTFEDDFNLLTAEIYVREKGVISLLNANQLN